MRKLKAHVSFLSEGKPSLRLTVPFCQACLVAFSLPGVFVVMELQH